MTAETINADAWRRYGEHHLTRGTQVPDVERIDWGWWNTGPDAEVLGDLCGKRVLEIGSGIARHAAYLVRQHGARIDALEASPTQHQRAQQRYRDLTGLNLIQGEAVEHLHTAKPYDVIYAMNTVPFIDPHRLLPAIAHALLPGGRLAFTTLHTNADGHGPSTEIGPRPETLHLAGGGILTVHMWVLTPTLWQDQLTRHGLHVDRIDILDAPDPADPVSYRLFHARSLPPQLTERRRSRHRALDQSDPTQTDPSPSRTRRKIMNQPVPWQEQLRDGTAPVQQEVIDRYRAVRTSRAWIPNMIWGTLQTRRYASVILRQVVDFLGTPDDVADGVAKRMERQQVLYEPGRRFQVLLGEQALYTNIGGPAVMAEQMDRLLTDFDLPTLRLGILPRTALMPLFPVNAFNLYDDTAIEVELVSSGLHITNPKEIALHIKALDLLDQTALYGDSARVLIKLARNHWRTDPAPGQPAPDAS